MSWDYIQPVNIKFGEGMLGKLKDITSEMGLKKGILVSDPFFAQNGLGRPSAEGERGTAGLHVFADLPES